MTAPKIFLESSFVGCRHWTYLTDPQIEAFLPYSMRPLIPHRKLGYLQT